MVGDGWIENSPRALCFGADLGIGGNRSSQTRGILIGVRRYLCCHVHQGTKLKFLVFQNWCANTVRYSCY
jgi:hypothetical protein